MTEDRSDAVLRHQDTAGLAGMPLGVFLGEELLGVMSRQQEDEPERSRYISQLATSSGTDPIRLEVLLLCHNHPSTAAVDCVACIPLEDS